jgi:hypothetical protein
VQTTRVGQLQDKSNVDSVYSKHCPGRQGFGVVVFSCVALQAVLQLVCKLYRCLSVCEGV